jgi:hypothetical protein
VSRSSRRQAAFGVDVEVVQFAAQQQRGDAGGEGLVVREPLFKSGTFVTVTDAGHATTFWSPCAQAIAVRFLQTLHTGDIRCAADRNGAMGNPFGAATGKVQLQGVAKFPTRASQAIPAQNDPPVVSTHPGPTVASPT